MDELLNIDRKNFGLTCFARFKLNPHLNVKIDGFLSTKETINGQYQTHFPCDNGYIIQLFRQS